MSDQVPEGWFVVNPRHMADLKAALEAVERVQSVADKWASSPICGTTVAHEAELREALGREKP